MLQVIEIQNHNPHYDIIFFSTNFYAKTKKGECSSIKMFDIEDVRTSVAYHKH
jgi:hypothetical protein